MKKPLRLLLLQGQFLAIYENRKQVALFGETPPLSPAEAEQIRTMDLSETSPSSPEAA